MNTSNRYFRNHFLNFLKSAGCLLMAAALVLTLLPEDALAAGSTDSAEEADYAAEEASWEQDEIIIVYKDDPLEETDQIEAEDADGEALTLSDAGVISQEEIADTADDGTAVLAQLDEDVSVEEAIALLEDDPAVDYVQPNYTYSLLSTDTVSSDADADSQYYLYSSSFTDAWTYARAEGSVTIAVLDTGCNLSHADLTQNLNTALAYDVTTDTLLSKSGTANSGDAIGHGTQVCGVIAAAADNGAGIAGASYDATLLPVKVFDSDDTCTTQDLIAAYAYLDELIDAGDLTDLKVINISLGYYADSTDDADAALESAIGAMRSEHGVLTVCAGGNGISGTAQTAYCYPADFDACVSVTAVDEDGANASFSDYNDAKDISAYGVDIYTTDADGGYTTVSGTSLASPQVAAAAALLWAADASLSADDVVELLQDTADDVTGNTHSSSGSAGIVNAEAAVTQALGVEADDAQTDDASADDSESDAQAAGSGSSTTNSTSNSSTSGSSTSSSSTSGSSTSNSVAEDDTEQEVELLFDSWRYSDGEVIDNPNTDSDSSLSILSTYPYSTWKASYGTSCYGIAKSSSSTVKVKVSGAVRVGIDVSKWQGEIDWEKVAADGITFAIIRCGYGKDVEDYDDEYFLQNVEGALANGIEIGIYLYSYASTTTYAASEAQHVLRLLDEANLGPSDLDLPIFMDMEDGVQKTVTEEQLAAIAEAFLEPLEDEDYAVGVYSSKSWWDSILTDSTFNTNTNWYKWVARYPVSSSVTSSTVDNTDIWQFSSKAKVSGISGNVDVNFDYLGSGSYVSKPGKTTLKSATLSSDATSVTLKWSKVTNVDGYRIYRKTGDGSYQLIKTITSGSTLTYKDTDIELSTSYTYRVRAYRIKRDGTTKVFGSYSSTKTVTAGPGIVSITSAVSTAKGSIKVTWEATENADGYEIYRSENGGSYRKIKTITDGSKVSFTNSSVTCGTVYRYRIKAYMLVGSTKIYSSSWSKVKRMTARPAKVSITSAKNTSSGYVKVKWEQTESADGYFIYRSASGGAYKKVATVTGVSTLSWTDKTVKPGRVYRYKVKAYVNVSGSKYTNTYYSSVKKVTGKPATASIRSVTSTKSKSATVKWKSIANASGYQIAYRIKGSSKWNYVRVSSTKKTFTNLNHKNYYVKVRAYTVYKGSRVYGSWSDETLMQVK